MAEKYDIETPYKPVLEKLLDSTPLPETSPPSKGDLLDDLYQDDVLQKDDEEQAREAEPGFAPGVPSPGSPHDKIGLDGLPSPFSPETLQRSIDLVDTLANERYKLFKSSLDRLGKRITELDERRKKLMAWELNNPDAANRLNHLERLIASLEDKKEDREVEFWKNLLPLKEKRLALEEELAEVKELEEEIARIVWTD